jgi:hypothetical protein
MSQDVGLSISITGMALGGMGALTMHSGIKRGQAIDALDAAQMQTKIAAEPADVITHRSGKTVDVTKAFSEMVGSMGHHSRSGPNMLLKAFAGIAVGSALLGAGIMGASLMRGDGLP